MFNGFFTNKRVFITGDTGFKGAWLSLWLHRMGATVGSFSLPPHTTPSLFELADINSINQCIGGDVRDPEALSAAISHFQPDIIIHMAAQALVRPSYSAPLATFATNVMGTANLLEAVRNNNCVKAVVNVTSDKCYENKEWVWGYRESDPMGGHDPYSASKGCAELITASYVRSFFKDGETAVATVRAGNVIGGGDFAKDRLIPDMVRAFRKGETVKVRYPLATRPWQHVLEPLRGYLMLARQLVENGNAYEGAWNLGPPDESNRTVGEVVTTFCDLWGNEASSELDQINHPHEANLLKLDCSKAHKILGWLPVTSFEQALDWTASWYIQWNNGADTKQITLEQIQQFEKLSC